MLMGISIAFHEFVWPATPIFDQDLLSTVLSRQDSIQETEADQARRDLENLRIHIVTGYTYPGMSNLQYCSV